MAAKEVNESSVLRLAVEELEHRAESLLELMRERIDSYYYDSVLVDCESGRIPGGIMWWAIHEIYGEKKVLGRFFVRGGKRLKDSEEIRAQTREYLHRVGPVFGGRVLLVTEEILTGESEEEICQMLSEVGMESEIAAFGIDYDDYDQLAFDRLVNRTPLGFRLYLPNLSVPLSLFGDLGEGLNGVLLEDQAAMGRRLTAGYFRVVLI